jgi:hypothetical protein
VTKHLIRLAKFRMRRQMLHYATELRYDELMRAGKRARVPVIECGPCGRRGRWAYPNVSATPRYCSYTCQIDEIDQRAYDEAMAPFYAAQAVRAAAQAKADDARWAEESAEADENDRTVIVAFDPLAEGMWDVLRDGTMADNAEVLASYFEELITDAHYYGD